MSNSVSTNLISQIQRTNSLRDLICQYTRRKKIIWIGLYQRNWINNFPEEKTPDPDISKSHPTICKKQHMSHQIHHRDIRPAQHLQINEWQPNGGYRSLYLPKLIECTILWVKCNVNCEYQVIRPFSISSPILINAILWWRILIIQKVMNVWRQRVYGKSLHFPLNFSSSLNFS